MNVDEINQRLEGAGIRVIGTYVHAKASEAYVEVEITGSGNLAIWDGAIPYQYRRTGLWLNTEQEVSDYLRRIKGHFEPDTIRDWVESERRYWDENFKRADVTTPSFHQLLTMKWVSTHQFPLNPDGTPNSNLQSMIRRIKDKGYTVASKSEGKIWKRKLLPLPRQMGHSYETISSKLRARMLEALNAEDVYELSSANRVGLITDHKFPEIRWDSETPSNNPDDMPDDEIRAKFQLVNNQRNDQKREVCRHCFNTGQRGKLFGIDFFYAGGVQWDNNIPRTGVAAEPGCVGCGWYDISAWRAALNNQIREATA